ncbi:protease TldD [Buchnera aphidicola (Schlechtendalia chinensis)]|uniref:Protease TldD n=1 Tax=Buchnera aphidicola subsp. Schlechtendalia chinensis TaxID=118110 RepID=A0A172WDU3_BUCSC|nr:metalloprotease TldD [Buchnera aphidicola]ANF17131.1 protease TldD [Buchnera aphidicola (Schlechtendalia chinensis)]
MVLHLVTECLLTSNKITHQNLYEILSDISKNKIDYSDLYFQSKNCESWILEDNIIKRGTFNVNQGVGIRVISGESTGLSYSNDITLNALRKCSTLANGISNKKFLTFVKPFSTVISKPSYTSINPLMNFSSQEKIEILHRVNSIARSSDRRVISVNAVLSSEYEQVLVAATDGVLAADIRPLVRLSVNVVLEYDGKRECGFSGGGSRDGYNFFLKNYISNVSLVEHYAQEAVRIALVNIFAKNAPSGTFPVVLGPGWPGILLHEAVGHGLEGDFNRQGTSIFSNKIGHKVASTLCTIVDDGTIENKRGSLTIDDEGVPSQYNVLIQNGILKSYIQDKFNSRLMGVNSTGNGRRESYAHLPCPRMTNTYMISGNSIPKDIIDSVEYGIYALNFSGGQVDITSGNFVFSTSEAYLIKFGKIVHSIKNVMLIGSGSSIMQGVSMVGNDFLIDGGVGTCSKNGQNVPVGVGQPTIKLNNITVGGTS